MNNQPLLLPDILDLAGEWPATLEKLYNVFRESFKDNITYYKGMRVVYDNRVLEGDKEEGFWHLITEVNSGDRIPDYNRAEKLPWIKPIIENSTDSQVKEWDYLEGSGHIRTYLWLENSEYAIILEKGTKRKRKGMVYLITAFPVGESKTRDLTRKYQNKV